MNRIEQRTKTDCGVACVAMLIQRHAGCPARSAYDAAKAIMFGTEPASYTETRDLKRALSAFGIKVGYRTIPHSVRAKELNLEFDAIVETPLRKDGISHYMVWDASRREVLDPSPRPYKDIRIVDYLRVGS